MQLRSGGSRPSFDIVSSHKKSWADFSSSEDDGPQGLGWPSGAESEDEAADSCRRESLVADRDALVPSSFGMPSTEVASSKLPVALDNDEDGDCCSTTATETEPPFIGIWSAGGEFHNEGNCKPCIFFRKTVGCSNGEDCPYCHFYHGRRPRHSKAKRRQQAASEDIGSAARNLENFRIPSSLRESPAEGPWPVWTSTTPPFSRAASKGREACLITEATVGAALSGALQPYDGTAWCGERDILRTPSPEISFEPAVLSALQPHDCTSWGVNVEFIRTPTPEPEWDRLR